MAGQTSSFQSSNILTPNELLEPMSDYGRMHKHIEGKYERKDENTKPTQSMYHRLFYNFEKFWQPNISLPSFFQNTLTDDYFRRKWYNGLTEPQQNEILDRLAFISTKFEKYVAADNSKKNSEALYFSSTGMVVGSLGSLAAVGIPCAIASVGAFRLHHQRKDRYRKDIVDLYLQNQKEGERGNVVGEWICSFIHVFANGISCSISGYLEEINLLKKLTQAEFV